MRLATTRHLNLSRPLCTYTLSASKPLCERERERESEAIDFASMYINIYIRMCRRPIVLLMENNVGVCMLSVVIARKDKVQYPIRENR